MTKTATLTNCERENDSNRDCEKGTVAEILRETTIVTKIVTVRITVTEIVT